MPFTFSNKIVEVLVVEADAAAAETISGLLHRNFHPRIVQTLEEAENLLDSTPPDILMCADDLAEESGLVFLERTHNRWPNIPKIIMVPKMDGELFFNAMKEAPQLVFLEKPVEKTALHRALRNALRDPNSKSAEELLQIRKKPLNSPKVSLPASNGDTPTAQIIIVESDEKSAKNLSRLIPSEFQCRIIPDLSEAEQILDLNPPDIFICSQEQSGENGLSFLQRTHDKWPRMHRILTVFNPDGEFFFHAMNDARVTSFLNKPVKKSELLSRLRHALQESSADLDEDIHSEEGGDQRIAGVMRLILMGLLLLISSAGVFMVFLIIYHVKRLAHLGTMIFSDWSLHNLLWR